MLSVVISIFILGAAVVWFIITYYDFLFLQKNIVQSAANLQLLLDQRNEEVGTLIQTIKGHNAYEQKVIIDLAKARAQLIKAKDNKEKAEHDIATSKHMKSVLDIQKHYPKLHSHEKFARIQTLEMELQNARQLRSETISTYNAAREKFPRNIIAATCSFKKEEDFYAISDQVSHPAAQQ
ncbi:MAG TPA: LemA family protein [Acidobacteriota bacterium]|nr:LemA family protein [Acidobacteriota bacterium]